MMSEKPSFFAELKRRNVSKVAVATPEKTQCSPGWQSICELWFAVPLCILRNA
jgi:hypothetical protein